MANFTDDMDYCGTAQVMDIYHIPFHQNRTKDGGTHGQTCGATVCRCRRNNHLKWQMHHTNCRPIKWTNLTWILVSLFCYPIMAVVSVTSRCKPKPNLTRWSETKARHTQLPVTRILSKKVLLFFKLFILKHAIHKKNDKHKRQNSLTSPPDTVSGQRLEFTSQ